MARVKRGVTTHARHKKVLKQAEGYRGRSKNVYKVAIERVEKGLQYAYRDRRVRKRSFRGLWIQRINAGARLHGLTYSQFMNGMKRLSDIAVREPEAFKALVETAQSALAEAPQG
jgi:large subunit ribosomal protein L20